MSVIDTSIEPHRVTRIFLDCRDAPPEPVDLRCIKRAIEQSIAMADTVEDVHSEVVKLAYHGAGDELAGTTGCRRAARASA